jgi:hypothetical protein
MNATSSGGHIHPHPAVRTWRCTHPAVPMPHNKPGGHGVVAQDAPTWCGPLHLGLACIPAQATPPRYAGGVTIDHDRQGHYV